MIVEAPVLVGRRVVLRPYSSGFDEAELGALYRWGRDDDLLALSGGRRVDASYERFRELFLQQIDHHNTEHEQLFAILAERRLIGRVGLFGIDPLAATAELGIVIGERDCWGAGYGRDAVATVVDFGFGSLGLERVVLHTYQENVRAQRAFAAAGFRAVRELRRFSFERGAHSEIEMEMRAPR
jgi:RimJ/RimL family protein N-acetyltransferase